MELTDLIKEMQTHGFINIKHLNLCGTAPAVATMTRIMSSTSAQEKEPEWWTVRAKILAHDLDRNYQLADLPLDRRVEERRN